MTWALNEGVIKEQRQNLSAAWRGLRDGEDLHYLNKKDRK
jgi:hypothetical protein